MDKLVILARGLGTRMRRSSDSAAVDAQQTAVADTGVKALIPIDRPFLDYVLSAAADAGYCRACLVIGPEQEAIRQYYSGLTLRRISVSFANQEKPRGTADAVASVAEFAGDDPFAVVNSDNYYPVEALKALRELDGYGLALFEQDAMLRGSNVPAARIMSFAVGKLDADNYLEKIMEKPDAATLASLPKPLWVSMNCWRFGPAIFEACRAIPPSPRGEYEIPDAVNYVMHVLGKPFRAVTVRAPVLDMTSRDDIGPVAAILRGTKVEL
jgi:dTDP-glucose pyrophosphorylase